MKNKLLVLMTLVSIFCAIPYMTHTINDPLEDTDIDDFLPKRMDKQYLKEQANERKEHESRYIPSEVGSESWSPEEEDLSDEALAEYGEYPEEDEYMYEEEYPEEEMMPEEEFGEEGEYWYPEDEELPEQNEVEEVEEMMPQEEVNERDVRMM